MARYLVTFLPGNPIPTRTKYIDDAVGPPDANADAGTDGVSFGSILWDGTDLWFCVDATTAAAVWEQVNGGGGGDGDTPFIDLSVSGAHTIDRAVGATHDLTLTGSTTFTMAGAIPGRTTAIWLWLRPDGNTVTWDPLINAGSFNPDLSEDLVLILLATLDDGASWVGVANADDQTAAQVPFTPAGPIAATDTQAAVEEVAADAASALSAHAADPDAHHPATTGGIGPLLLASDHAVPIVFDDILQASDGSDFLYASEP